MSKLNETNTIKFSGTPNLVGYSDSCLIYPIGCWGHLGIKDRVEQGHIEMNQNLKLPSWIWGYVDKYFISA